MNHVDAVNFYYEHPYEFVIDIIGATPTSQQTKVLKCLPLTKRVAARSGNGVGKTALECWIILWFLYVFPYSRVVATAPTQHQLNDVLWAELSKWLSKSKLEPLFNYTATTLSNKKYSETWFAVARSSNEPTNFQGFHEENILFVIDEASGVSDEIWEAVRGSLTTKNAYCFVFGNPNYLSGFFYDAFHKNNEMWQTFHFSSAESELVDRTFIKEIAQDYGEDSNQYRVRILGEFPLDSATDLYLPLSLTKYAMKDKNELWEDEPHPDFEYDLGVDIARFGDDETVMTISKHNTRYIEHKSIDIVHIYVTRHKPLTVVAGKIIDLYKHWHFKNIFVDETGLGGGVYDMLKEQGLPVTPVTFNKKLDQTIKDTNKEAFYKHLKILFEKQARHFEDKQKGLISALIPDLFRIVNLPPLITQLATLKFDYSSNGTLMVHHEDGGHDDYPDSLGLSLFRYVLKRKGKSNYIIT